MNKQPAKKRQRSHGNGKQQNFSLNLSSEANSLKLVGMLNENRSRGIKSDHNRNKSNRKNSSNNCNDNSNNNNNYNNGMEDISVSSANRLNDSININGLLHWDNNNNDNENNNDFIFNHVATTETGKFVEKNLRMQYIGKLPDIARIATKDMYDKVAVLIDEVCYNLNFGLSSKY